MADFTVPEETRLLLEGIRAFLRAGVEPREAALHEELQHPYDHDGRYVAPILAAKREIRMASSAAGYYQMFVPEEAGGAGGDFTTYSYAWEGLFRDVGPARPLPFGVIAHWAMGPSPLHRHLQPGVREAFVGPLLRGEESSCFALSEPDAGSDVWNMSTRAVRHGDVWRISGTKQWISNSPLRREGNRVRGHRPGAGRSAAA